jgi:hypothetical protein
MTESVDMLSTPVEFHIQAVERVAQTVAGIGSGVAITSGVAGMSGFDHEVVWMIGVICGSIAAIGGFAVTWYYKYQDNKRLDRIHRLQEIEHEIRMKTNGLAG